MDGFVFVAKGALALAGTLLLIYHMDKCWEAMRDRAQRARYLCLLGFGVLLTGASTEQVARGTALELRHWGSLTMAVALVATAVYSIRKHNPRRGK